jgi:crossover junction endodeoxyribonuclease RuvC
MSVTPKQFEQMRERLGAAKRTPAPAFETSYRPGANNIQIIIGVDPSLRGTGYGVIQLARPNPRALIHGTIVCPQGWTRSRCLAKIALTLREVLAAYRPTLCAIEGLFYAQNLQTAQIMGEARGAALATLAEAGLEIFEIAPRKVKQAVVGYGAAQKLAVSKMVQRMLQLAEPPSPDAADALAIALAFAQQSRSAFGIGAKKI